MIIYDLEIKKAVPPKDEEERDPKIQYCNGWGDKKGMGISVLCVYDFDQKRYFFYDDQNKDEFRKLVEKQDEFVGWNHIAFDNKVIEECWDIPIPKDQCLDLKLKFYPVVSLDDACEKNLDEKKSMSGALAPILYQEGKIAELYSYCYQDVRLTKMLYYKLNQQGFLINPKNDKKVIVDLVR